MSTRLADSPLTFLGLLTQHALCPGSLVVHRQGQAPWVNQQGPQRRAQAAHLLGPTWPREPGSQGPVWGRRPPHWPLVEGLITQDSLSSAVSVHTEGRWGMPASHQQQPGHPKPRPSGGVKEDRGAQHCTHRHWPPAQASGNVKDMPPRASGSEAGLAVSSYLKKKNNKNLFLKKTTQAA